MEKSSRQFQHVIWKKSRAKRRLFWSAKIVDVIARLPGCEGQAADSVSAHTQVKMEDVPQLLKNSKVRMSRCLDASSTTQMAKIVGED